MRRFLFYLAAAGFVMVLAVMLLPVQTGGGPHDSAKDFAKHDVRVLAGAFQLFRGSNQTNDTIHASTNGFLFSCGFQFQSNLSSNLWVNNLTNRNSELLDVWQTPYQIEIVSRTNFIIRSAGRDKIFGDADDIIFNSASNEFVKP